MNFVSTMHIIFGLEYLLPLAVNRLLHSDYIYEIFSQS